jgi:hypothetical protein
MKIVIEQGSHAWYAMTEGDAPQPYSGLLVTGNSMDDVIEKLPGALRELREAVSLKTADRKQGE